MYLLRRTVFIVPWLLDSSVSRPSGVLTEGKAQGLFGGEFRSTLALRITNPLVVSSQSLRCGGIAFGLP